MNRLGLPLHQGGAIIEELKRRGRSVYHLMSHFSESFDLKSEKTQRQYEAFLNLKGEFRRAGVSVDKTFRVKLWSH